MKKWLLSLLSVAFITTTFLSIGPSTGDHPLSEDKERWPPGSEEHL